ncbi:hypothetical protein ACF1AJ_20415 [Leifsonia sp. NPDC014704]|uniref:hypothetical protein n=1 Tax=Leifsonia sp. NPDC014704 TaxID=3364123 RepID=UPI0036F49AB7
MRFGSPALKGALTGSFDWRWVADIVFNGARVMQDVPVTAPNFRDSGSSLVQSTGECTILYQDDFARSIAPSQIGDLLAPFGTQVAVSVIVSVGDAFQERVAMGKYLIADTPSIRTNRYRFNGVTVSAGDSIDLTLKDLFLGVQQDRFDTPGSAPDLTSVWREYQRLTGLPVTRTVPDAPIPATVAYQEDKLQACYDLATVLDAVAYLTPDGTAAMRPNVWPAPVDTINSKDIDPDGGTLVDVVPTLSNEDVYNAVVVRGKAADGSQIVLAGRELTEGPLRAKNPDGSMSPFRRKPYYYSSDYITTSAQAAAYATQQLPRVSRLRSLTYEVEEIFNPLREVGDVVKVNRLGQSFTARVTDIARSGGATQKLSVVVNP